MHKYTCLGVFVGGWSGGGTDSAVITELAPLQLLLNFPTGTELGNNSNNNGNHTNNNNNKKLGRKRILNWLTLYMNRPKICLYIQIHKYNIFSCGSNSIYSLLC